MCGDVCHTLSPGGRPAMYLGTIQALERVDRVTLFCRVRDDSSTVMSAALLPMPATRIRLPVRFSGGVWGGSM